MRSKDYWLKGLVLGLEHHLAGLTGGGMGEDDVHAAWRCWPNGGLMCRKPGIVQVCISETAETAPLHGLAAGSWTRILRQCLPLRWLLTGLLRGLLSGLLSGLLLLSALLAHLLHRRLPPLLQHLQH